MRKFPSGRDWTVTALAAVLAVLSAGCGGSLPANGSRVQDDPTVSAAQADAYSKAYDSKGKPKGVASPATSQSAARRGQSSMAH